MRRSTLTVGALACTAAVFGLAPAAVAATPGLADSAATTTPMCATSQLSASLGGSDAGAGNLYRYLVLTNHSGTTCHVTGYPGLSMLDASGKQIGDPATRQPLAYSPVVLSPGASASDTVHTANRQTDSSTECLPTSAKLRIYPPGNKDALVFVGAVTNCDKLFSVTPFIAGTGGNPPSQPVPTASTPGAAASAPSTVGTATPAPVPSSAQVAVVPKGAPDTGLALTSDSGSGSDTDTIAGAAAGAVLIVGGLGTALLRRRSRGQSQPRG